MKKLRTVCLFVITSLSIAISASVLFGPDWKTADRSSANIAPDPSIEPEAVVQIYAARAFSWRSLFAVHTWISTKEKNAEDYTVYQVVGWRKWRDLPVVVKEIDVPDRSWFGKKPVVLKEFKGAEAEALIPAIDRAVDSYPFEHKYHVWPGPNSNTFIAHVSRSVPELKLDLPPTAIGKDFMTREKFIDTAPSGHGFQFSLYGLLGVIVSKVEGFEINVLGLNLGLGFSEQSDDSYWPIKLRLPLFGNLELGE